MSDHHQLQWGLGDTPPITTSTDGLVEQRFQTMLLDMLAVIHRDGGHKTEEIGVGLAWEQAMQLSSERIAAADRIEAQAARIAELEGALTSIANNACCGSCQEASLVARTALRGGTQP